MTRRDSKSAQSRANRGWRRKIVSIGAGGIVRAAHVLAYGAAGFEIVGVFDVKPTASASVARKLGVRCFPSLAEALAVRDVVFDLAVPPSEIAAILRVAPSGSALLVQKPFGRDIFEARALAEIVRRRRLVVAVNFQLRFSPAMRHLSELLEREALGTIRSVDVRVVTYTPFERWAFLRDVPRLEILYHSIHYLDCARALFGEPTAVEASARVDSAHPTLSDTSSSIRVEFEDGVKFSIETRHGSRIARKKRVSEFVVTGTRGSARIVLGVNLDYASPPPDALDVTLGERTRSVALSGSWFPEAFAGPMANVQRFVAGLDRVLASNAADAVRTMELVEACYRSSERTQRLVPKRGPARLR